MRRTILGAAVAAVLMAACGGTSSGSEDADAAPATETLTVRVTAEQTLGCTMSKGRSGLDVGNDSRLTVEDQDGAVIGTGTFALSPGLVEGVDVCDWTAEADVPVDADFYVLDGGGEMATLSRSELEADGWGVELHIAITGDVQVR